MENERSGQPNRGVLLSSPPAASCHAFVPERESLDQETPNTGSRTLREQDSTVPTDADPSTAVSVGADRRGRKSLSRDATDLVAVDGDILHSAQKRDPGLDAAAQDPVVFDGGEDVVVGRNHCCVPETPTTAARHDVPDLFERDLDLVEPTRDPGGPTGQKSSAVLRAGVSSRPDDWVSRLMSQPASKCWAKVFNNDATPTLAVLDRLLHPAETAVIDGKSYRIKDQIENSEVGALTRSIRGRRPPVGAVLSLSPQEIHMVFQTARISRISR
jgi:hypothetical protein